MTMIDTTLAAFGGSIATLALLLSALQLRAPWISHAALRVAMSWSRIPSRFAVPTLLALFAIAGVCLWPIDGSTGTANAEQSEALPSPLALLANAPGADEASDIDPRDHAIAKLRAYAGNILGKRQAIAALSGDASDADESPSLPDVETMIARLVARLQTQPDDIKGWSTLAWSYLNTGKFTEAVSAYQSALEHDPQNSELKAALEQARAKASSDTEVSTANAESSTALSSIADPARMEGDQNTMIRSMVERLASRLEGNPNDANGWVRLMRARTVLGQSDLAREALRKALAAFSDNPPVRASVTEAAREFGLSAY